MRDVNQLPVLLLIGADVAPEEEVKPVETEAEVQSVEEAPAVKLDDRREGESQLFERRPRRRRAARRERWCEYGSVDEFGTLVVPEGEVVAARTYKGNVEIRKVVLPASLKIIGKEAFEGCTELEEVEFPKGLTMIDVAAFQGCVKLRKVVIPGSVNTVGDYAFSRCVGLTELKIEKGVRIIGVDCFGYCANLRNFRERDLPRTVNRIQVKNRMPYDAFLKGFEGSPCVLSRNDRRRRQKAAKANEFFVQQLIG